MSTVRRTLKHSGLPVLLVLCLAALTASYAFADETRRPVATQLIGDPDAAVTGKFAVGTASPGNKALTVIGVIDFLGAGTVHNYFTQGAGNNMQINTNVDEANTIGDVSRSQWKLVLGSSLDWFSLRRSPAGGTYNEDALFFIQGSTGKVGIATVDTSNGGVIPFTLQARLHVETNSGDAIRGLTTATGGAIYGVYGESYSTDGRGLYGYASASTGGAQGVYGQSDSTAGTGVVGRSYVSSGAARGVVGEVDSTAGVGVSGVAYANSGANFGVSGTSNSPAGYGVYGVNTGGGVGLGTPGDALVGGSLELGSGGLTAVGGTETNLRVLRGGVNSDGTCSLPGSGYTCSRTSAGNYTVTFDTPFAVGQSATGVVTPSLAGTWDPHSAVITATSNASLSFRTYNSKGNASDVSVFFIAVGPR